VKSELCPSATERPLFSFRINRGAYNDRGLLASGNV
jgi:hypothetical protein